MTGLQSQVRRWLACAGLVCVAHVSLAHLSGAQAITGADDGVVVLTSDADFATTLARVEPAIKGRGLFVMRVMDHSAAAAQFGRTLAPNTVVLFGNPQIGSQLMACAPRAGLDLPQKLLLWEADGLVRVAYNDPAYLVRRHTITGCEEIVATIAENLRAISTLVAGRQDAPETLTSPTTEELRLLFEGDQADRQFETPPTPEEWAAITKRDNTRRNRVLDLVKSDALVSGKDFYHAAMVLQHGPGSEDILVAHILSTAAAYLGDARGKWLSAAALDRYLHRTKAAQRIGTQYVRANNADPWSQGAYDDWLPDSIRTIFGVEGRAQQQERVRGMNRHAP